MLKKCHLRGKITGQDIFTCLKNVAYIIRLKLNVGECFLLAPFSWNNPNNISILNTCRYNFLRTCYWLWIANEVCLCQSGCVWRKDGIETPNNVKPEAKTLNQSPPDIDMTPNSQGEQSFILMLYVFLCLHVVKGLIKDELFIAYCSLSILRFVPLKFGKECAQEDPQHCRPKWALVNYRVNLI